MSLTSSQAREMVRADPVILVEIALCNGGPTLYFSDRNIDIAGQHYEDYLLNAPDIDAELQRVDSGGRNADIQIRFKNDPFPGYAYLVLIGDAYPWIGATVTVKESFIDAILGVATPATIFVGALDEPRDITLTEFSCNVSNMVDYKDSRYQQPVVNSTDFVEAKEDIGRPVPIVFGANVLVPTIKTGWGAETTLAADITADDTTIPVTDDGKFWCPWAAYIDDELFNYTGKTGVAFTGCTRDGGTKVAHSYGAVVKEYRTNYDCLISGKEIHSLPYVYGMLDGKLVRIVSGATLYNTGGRSYVRMGEHIRVVSAGSLEASHNLTAPPDTVSVSDGIGVNNGSLAVADNINFSSLPSTFSQISPMITWPYGLATGTNGYLTFPPGPPSVTDYVYVKYHIDIYQTFWGGTGTAVLKWNGITVVTATPQSNGTITMAWNTNLGGFSGGGMSAFFIDAKTSWQAQSPSFTLTASPGSCVGFQIWAEEYTTVASQSLAATKTGAAYKSGSVAKSGSVSRTGDSNVRGSVTITGSLVDTRTIERVYVMANGVKDPDGNYGGAGNLIERPDLLMKYWLVQVMGYSLGSIDSASFSAAGSWYGSAGYALASYVEGVQRPSEVLRQMALNCRSVILYRAGTWYLNVLPDTAPSPAKTISWSELAGKGSLARFSVRPRQEISNSLSVRYKKNYTDAFTRDLWSGALSVESIVGGLDKLPSEIELEWVRNDAVASSVSAHLLVQRKSPLLIVTFPLFWEHSDLCVGDTIQFTHPLWSGKKFFIEQFQRRERHKIEVRALEWWS